MEFEPIHPEVNKISGIIVDAAFQVHSYLGPGLLESVYKKCLIAELRDAHLKVLSEVQIPIKYKHHDIDANLRIDLLVEDSIIVELKAVDQMFPVFESQILTYMKLSKKRLGLLINFNVPIIKNGIKRIIL